MKTKYKYIFFKLYGESITGKTVIYQCKTLNSRETIGEAKWFGQWFQYCFFPEPDTIFNSGCLKDIQDFLNNLNKIHKQEQKTKV